jgi:predicted aldo/keto reductase-like oxidoreductase
MNRRKLGRTGLAVGEIGIGTEYLHGQPRETVVEVVRGAVERGINYFDILWAYPDYLDNLGAALEGLRDRVTLTLHLGPAVSNGQYRLSRDASECEAIFADMLARLGTDHADVVMVQWVDKEDDYAGLADDGGLLTLARSFRDQGKARFIGLSSHVAPVAQAAVLSGDFDVLMFPINPAFDALPGRSHIEELDAETGARSRGVNVERRRLFQTCAAEGIGLVGMKPFAGGRLFHLAESDKGGLNPVRLLSYALSQAGVSAVVPGVKNRGELESVMAYLSASAEEKEFGEALAGSAWRLEGGCVYCNHCLPCPVGIDVGQALRLAAIADQGMSDDLRAAYAALPAEASECTECGSCSERCPFGVDVIPHMRRAADLFGR